MKKVYENPATIVVRVQLPGRLMSASGIESGRQDYLQSDDWTMPEQGIESSRSSYSSSSAWD